MKLRPRNWKDFQHYSDRKPAWVKLHRGLLDDYEFHCLPVASRALAPLLWLVASEHEEGEFDANYAKLAFRFRMQPKEIEEAVKPLIAAKFFEVVQDASNALAEAEQNATSERERETEEEREKEGATAPVVSLDDERRKRRAKIPDPAAVPGLNAEVWAAWVAYRIEIKKPLRPASQRAAMKKLASLGEAQGDAVENSIANGWTGLFAPKADKRSASITDRLTWRPTE